MHLPSPLPETAMLLPIPDVLDLPEPRSPHPMIDLRSDTLTLPTEDMRAAMLRAVTAALAQAT